MELSCEMVKESNETMGIFGYQRGDIQLSKVAKETIFIRSKIINSTHHTLVLPIESRKKFLEDEYQSWKMIDKHIPPREQNLILTTPLFLN